MEVVLFLDTEYIKVNPISLGLELPAFPDKFVYILPNLDQVGLEVETIEFYPQKNLYVVDLRLGVGFQNLASEEMVFDYLQKSGWKNWEDIDPSEEE
ncbi:MAG TPA: hypothetical protein VFX17_00065 [Patescibacteria group bacterium]|nr:hypothetical protein [Patescibacteria group bacterium]